ncbi:MAG TPA: glycosyltransferase [Opitutaceae bacterium]|nr:glycosyltransferase [Opitutaceae bacterium]
MPLLDLTHTSHTRARTGVQRVARSLARALGERALPICFDPYRRAWRLLEAWERANLAAMAPAAKRGAQWPWSARLRGYFRRGAPAVPELYGADGLIVPEIFSPTVAAALPPLLAGVDGARVALFHDAIALQLPELTPAKTVGRFPSYLRELLAFDGVAAISEASRQSLLDYWAWLGAASPPPVAAIPLGIDAFGAGRDGSAPPAGGAAPVILCVASVEGRKNHLALLEACEQLWAQGRSFTLHLVGLGQPQTGGAALAKIAALQTAGRPLRYDGPVDEAALQAAYRECAFTVYPSLLEGFGLPVLESLARGRPCVCSGRGALGEAARGGGCLPLESVGAAALAGAVGRLLAEPATLERLAAEARARPVRPWGDYARDLLAWMESLARR